MLRKHMKKSALILEKLGQQIVVGDGGTLFELERRGYVSAGQRVFTATGDAYHYR
jgi:hypothetical protein